jgi:hypothetical protein
MLADWRHSTLEGRCSNCDIGFGSFRQYSCPSGTQIDRSEAHIRIHRSDGSRWLIANIALAEYEALQLLNETFACQKNKGSA